MSERFQRFMAAAAFAESGETETALEILDAPKKTTTVLLAVGGSYINKEAFRYAVNLCRRMDASLDVLHVVPEECAHNAESGRISLEGYSAEIGKLLQEASKNRVSVHLSVTVGDVDREVCAYAKDNREVVAVVLDSPYVHGAGPERGKCRRVLQILSRRLAVPLITAESKGQV